MAQSAQIAKVSHRHEALLQYMIANPTVSGKELALEFGMTQAWVSTIIHSDAFQAKLAERQDEVFVEVVIPLRTKLEGVAHAAVERLGQAVQDVQDPRMILDIADKTLHRLGYAPSQRAASGSAVHQNNTQVNVYGVVDAETIARARGLMKQTQGVPALEHNSDGEKGADQ